MHIFKYIWVGKLLFKKVLQNPPDFYGITFLTTNRTVKLDDVYNINIGLF